MKEKELLEIKIRCSSAKGIRVLKQKSDSLIGYFSDEEKLKLENQALKFQEKLCQLKKMKSNSAAKKFKDTIERRWKLEKENYRVEKNFKKVPKVSLNINR